MKKLVTILLVLLVFVGGLFGLDIPGKKPIKGKLVDILFKKFYEITPIDAQDGIKGSGFDVYKVDEPKFKDYQAYRMYLGPVVIGKSGGRRYFTMLVKDDKVYDHINFNTLLKDSHTKIDKTNFKEILNVYYQLNFHKNNIKIFYIKWNEGNNKIVSKKDSFDYDIEVKFKYLLNGTIFKDNFKLKDGYIYKRRTEYLYSKIRKKFIKVI